MKKKLNRWLALLMAVTMTITSAIYTSGIATASESALKAAEEELAAEGAVETATGETETLPTETTEPEVVQQDVPQPDPIVVVPEEQPAETQPMAETPLEEPPVEVKYSLTLHKPDVAGGTIQSWTTGEKTDRTNGHTEEIAENTIYNMEVTAFENYEIDKVTDHHGNVISPKSVAEKVYLFEIPITDHIELNITYKEIPKTTPEETPNTEPKEEETQKEESIKEDSKEDNSKNDEHTDKWPAIDFEDEVAGITVIVNAPEGAFPKDTVMKVKAVSDDVAKAAAEKIAGKDKEVTKAKAVDITFYNKKGDEIQPKVPVKVQLLNTGVEGEETGTFRKNADDSVEKISSSGNAFEAEHFTVYGTFATSEDSGEGIYATSDGLHITLHNTPYGDLPAYCYNAERSYPSNPEGTTVRYKSLVEYNGQENADANAVRNLLYAGDPFDALGYRKLDHSDITFRISTQNALWVLLGQEPPSIISHTPAAQAIYNAARQDNIPEVGELRVDNENIIFKEEKISIGNGYKWIYKTEPISLSGYAGTYILQLPDGIRAFDVNGNEKNSFSTTESFHLEADSEEALNKLISENQLTMSASYSYNFPNNIYYAEAVDKQYQNLLCWTTSQGTVTATFSAEAQITAREGFHIYYTLNGDSDIVHETSIEARDFDDFRQQFKENEESLTQNTNLKDYCDTNGLDYSKFAWDKNPREVNNAIYLNFNANEKVTVTFDPQGGEYTENTNETVSLDYGAKLVEKETASRNPKKNHYDFSGWYDKSSEGTKVTSINRVLKNTTLYAQYTPAQYQLIVKIDGDINSHYAQTKGYKDSFSSAENAEYKISEGYYIKSVKITGGADSVSIEYTTGNDELKGNTNTFKLPSIPKITSDIEGDCLVEIHTAQLKTMTVSADPVTKTYDGNKYGVEAKVEQVVKDLKIFYYNEKNEKYDLEESPLYTDVKLDENGNVEPYTVKFKATAPGYKDATGETTVTINPRSLTVKADDKERELDAETDPDLTYRILSDKEGGLVAGEEPVYDGKLTRDEGTAPGTYPIRQGTLKLADSDTFKAANYILEFQEGKLIIYAVLTLEATPLKSKYNGQEQYLPKATAKATEDNVTPLIEYSSDKKNWSTKIPARKDVTEETIYVRAYVNNAEHYKMAETTTSITITPATLTVTANNISNHPAGTEIPQLTGMIEGFLSNDSFEKDVEGELSYSTDATKESLPGEYDIEPDVSKLTSKNYIFEKVNGTLSIVSEQDIILSGGNVVYPYDGMEHTLESFTLESFDGEILANWNGTEMYKKPGTTIKYKSPDEDQWKDISTYGPPRFTDVGIYELQIKGESKYYLNNSPMETWTVTITPAPVKVKANSFEVPFTDPEKEDKISNLTYNVTMPENINETPNFSGKLNLNSSDTNPRVGSYDISQGSLELTDGEGFKASNYTLDFTKGTAKITGKLDLDVEAYNDYYDGDFHTITAVATADDERETLLIEYSLNGTDWDSSEIYRKNATETKILVRVKAKNNTNYEPVDDETAIIISKVPLTIKATDLSDLAYGSEIPLLTGQYVDGLVANESLEDALTNLNGLSDGSYTTSAVAGSPVGDYEISAQKGNLSSDNYDLIFQPGKLTIVQANNLSVAAEGKDVIYDGNAHTLEKVTFTGGESTKLSYSVDDGITWQVQMPEYTEVGVYPVKVKAENANYSNTPVTETVFITIRPKDVTIQVSNATKPYGTNDPVFTGIVDGLINADDLGAVIYERDEADRNKEEVGDDITLTAAYTDNKNYNVNVSTGKLDITPLGELHVTVTDTEVVYDGNEYGIIVSPTPGSTPMYSTDGTNWSEIPPVYNEVGEYDVFVKTVQDGYTDSQTVSGKIRILPREIEITAASAEKTYDGTPLVATSAYLTSGTLADGEEITSITVNGSQTEVGNSANVASNVIIMSGTENVTRNYQTEYADGTLTVTEVQAALVPVLTPILPVTPAAPTTPTTPGAVTPAPVAPAAFAAAPTDVNAPTEADGVDRGYDLTEVADTETPLANMGLDDHDCCIFHFLLMLMLLLVSILYTRSMKKRQKRMFELQEEYELELIKQDIEKYDADGKSKHIA